LFKSLNIPNINNSICSREGDWKSMGILGFSS